MVTQMNLIGFARLLLLAALWGGSFLFMRMTASVVGPAWLILARVGLAAFFLWMVAKWFKKGLQASQYWRHYLVLGFFNSALPFLLFAYAAQTISASLLSILNATAPMWAAIIAVVWLQSELSMYKWVGMGFGLVGVALLAGIESMTLPAGGMWAIAAGLVATLSYGIATNYTKVAPNVESFSNAHGSMWAATLVMIPVALATPMPAEISMVPTGLAVLALGIVCSGVAYLIYFSLIADFGGVSALTVTFLIPVFGTIWGAWLLGEPVTWTTVGGGLLVLLGTAMVTGFSPMTLFGRTKQEGTA
jgi:drug/metabolite transporter (DMT)-like permease